MARLGSSKRPARARVQTMSRAEEILALCDERGWKVVVGVEAEEPEDVSDIEKLTNVSATSSERGHHMPKIGRNAPCPCGGGSKYKNCCGRR